MSLLEKLQKLGVVQEAETVRSYLHSGSLALNRVISGKYNGGYPCPGIVEISGESSSGKTVFLAHAFREAQKKGWYVKLEDAEGTWDSGFATKLGVDKDKILINSNLETLEDAFDSMEKTIKAIREEDKTTPILIGLDSLPVLPTLKEFERDSFKMGETTGMIRAAVTGSCLRKIYGLSKKENVLFIIINQLRSKMVMFGSPDTRAAGGRSLEYYLTVSLKTSFSKSNGVVTDSKDSPIGLQGKIKNDKNKISIPYLDCEFQLSYDTGLDNLYGLVPMLVKDGLVTQSGAWYSVGAKKFHQKDFVDLLNDKSMGDFDGLRDLLFKQ